MRKPIHTALTLIVILTASAPAFSQNYSNDAFYQSLWFNNTRNYYYWVDEDDGQEGQLGYLNEILQTDFSIEFWLKVPKDPVPGRYIFSAGSVYIYFSSGYTDQGLVPLIGATFAAFEDNDAQTGYYYEPTGNYLFSIAGEIPNDNEWVHVALVRNYQTYINDSEPWVDYGYMGIYINGELMSSWYAPNINTMIPPDFFSIGPYYPAKKYMKIDEFRLWDKALSPTEINTHMNHQIPNSGAAANHLILHYDFNYATDLDDYVTMEYHRNKSRGFGSPTNDQNPDAFRLREYRHGADPVTLIGKDYEYTTTGDGDWDDPDTWGGRVPYPGEIVNISDNVTLTGTAETGGINFSGGGKLILNGNTLKLNSSPIGAGEDSYIVMALPGDHVDFNTSYYFGATLPIGNNYYNPVTFSKSTTDNFTIGVDMTEDLSAYNIPEDEPAVQNAWNITPEAGNVTQDYPLSITLQWNGEQMANDFDINQPLIGNLHGEDWLYITPQPVEPAEGSDNYSTTFESYNFSPFVLLNNQILLPLTLLDFDVQSTDGVVAELQWTTTAESDVSHFIIEKSTDGQRFGEAGRISFVKSQAINSFRFNDPIQDIRNGQIYYRIKTVDHSGQYNYSPVRSIRKSADPGSQIYPNPLNVQTSQRLYLPKAFRDLRSTIQLYDAAGSLKLELSHSGEPSIEIPSSFSGLFIVRISGENGLEYKEQLLIISK